MNSLFKDLLEDDETPATILNCVIIQELGPECYNWELETIWLELMKEFHIDKLSEFIKEKISSIITLNTSSQFYDYWEPFENICKAFNHQRVHFEDLTPLSSEELTWGVMESKLNDETYGTFSYDVLAYANTVFKSEGVCFTPKFIAPIIHYKSYCDYDKEQEAIKQARIESYCLLQINKVIDLSSKYFGKDVRKSLIEEIPELDGYVN